MTVLVLDLDGTVSRSDTLIESMLRVLAEKPWLIFQLIWSLIQGRAAFKHRVADSVTLDPAGLIYNDEVLEHARTAKAQNRLVYLVTAADSAIANSVASYLGCFDGVFASDGHTNLKGEAKAAFLVAQFGARGFDYIGDAEADIPVWHAAEKAFVVAPAPALLTKARAANADIVCIGTNRKGVARLRILARTLRIHQWAKNVLVFVPAFAAHHATPGTLVRACLGFFAFSLCASSVYVLNDLVDLPHDRAHASKRRRPFASGALPLSWGPFLMGGALLGGFAIAVFLPPAFFLMLLGYYACTLSYSFVLKRQMVWDVMMLAGLYTIRVFAGSAATGIRISPWLLAFSMFLFFCLAIVKRQTELTQHVKSGKAQKISGRGYMPEDLDMLRSMASASGYMAVLVMALYVNSADVLPLYRHPSALWALCPILLFWVSRVLMLAHRGQMNDDPVIFALRDRVSLATGAVALAAIIVAAW